MSRYLARLARGTLLWGAAAIAGAAPWGLYAQTVNRSGAGDASAPAPARAPSRTVVPTTGRQPALSLDSLVMTALRASPRVRAARERLAAARAGIAPAGARPDPMLMAGVQNFPVSQPGFQDFMTMKMVGVSQSFPYPGKLRFQTQIAEREAEAAAAELATAARSVVRDVRAAYYDLAYVERALGIVESTRDALGGITTAAEGRYAVGAAGQQDVLRARVEAARLGEQASALREQRRATIERLAALLDLPDVAALGDSVAAAVPERVARAAVAASPAAVRFVSATLGARATGSPLPPLDSLQALAVSQSPEIRAAEARIAAQAARISLARLAVRPDPEVSVSYGQRMGFTDMVTATVSIPIPIQRARKQDQLVVAARSELAAAEAARRDEANTLRAEVARLYGDLERDRAQLAVFVKGVLPQAQSAREASLANYQVGRADLTALLDTQTTLFNYEVAYYRTLSDFATSLAELERVVGAEVLR